jgi:hypothetical protein
MKMETLTTNTKKEVNKDVIVDNVEHQVSKVLTAIETPTLHENVTLTEGCIINAIETSNLDRLRTLYAMLKGDKTTFVIKQRLAFRKLVRDSIFELSKLEDKTNVTTEVQSKVATDKQNASTGFNKMIDIERRSLGACLNTINGALTLAKESPNKVYDFKETKERYDALTNKVYKITTEFSVKFEAVKFDIVNYARKNPTFYAELANLIQIADLGNLTEKKVNKFINENLARLQDIKVEIKAKK